MTTRVLIAFYSMYGHVYQLARAVAAGEVDGAKVARAAFAAVPLATPERLAETTLTSFHTTLLHLGMGVVGVPDAAARLLAMQEISGGTPRSQRRWRGDK